MNSESGIAPEALGRSQTSSGWSRTRGAEMKTLAFRMHFCRRIGVPNGLNHPLQYEIFCSCPGERFMMLAIKCFHSSDYRVPTDAVSLAAKGVREFNHFRVFRMFTYGTPSLSAARHGTKLWRLTPLLPACFSRQSSVGKSASHQGP